MNKLNQIFATTLLLLTANLQAKLSTAKIFSNHMVIQRELAAPVWGWDDPDKEITVHFAGQEHKATADKKGRWQVKLNPLTANTTGQPMTISSSAGETITYQDILIGDVWICSGQSNMEWSVKQSHNPQQEISQAYHPMIRLFDVKGHTIAGSPQSHLIHASSWQPCSPKAVTNFSAVGYYFGRELQQQSGVPIGLLGTNWGGTRVEPWTPPVGFRKQPELAAMSKNVDAQLTTTPSGKKAWSSFAQQAGQWATTVKQCVSEGRSAPPAPRGPGPKNHNEPCSIYNAMVHPLVGYGVRGAIWYQGESNSGEGIHYLPKLKALVEGWREVWQQPADFPFYFYVVKLAQFKGHTTNPEGGDGFARIRVAQDRIQELPHTGIASAIDIGHPSDIHPKNKQDVGKRLALWALRDVYGKKGTVVSGPTFKELKLDGNTATIHFDHLGSGLMVAKKKDPFQPVLATPNAKLASFAICGADRKWHWADAVIEGSTVKLSSSAVSAPVAVRYAYRGNPANANLYNKEGLPAIPFRTDDWNP
ncbi:MAG: sialate O-acetylesterase [Akkermansiaceae bacterium]